MEIAPDGRIFVCLQGGQLRVIKNGALLPTPFLSLTVDPSGERGLLGIAFDPNFQSNNFIYVYYTATTTPRHNRVSRFTANGDVALAGSELPILDLENLSAATNHNGGAIHFGPDGKLYVAVGDNANGANSQTLANRLGKMLRINSDGSIPSDNPFFNTATGLNRSIWALGLRNPFTFAFQPGTGRMFINDVGQNTWEEINDGIAGSNYGWPNTEGATNNPSFRSPLFSYGHGNSATTGCAIAGGAFYNPARHNQFGEGYIGRYFFADLCSGWIRVFNPATNTASGFATGVSSPVDLKVDADGSLYYLAIGSGSVFVVTTGDVEPPPVPPPFITSQPSDQTVAQGQSATFQITADGPGILTYQWTRNGVDIPSSSSPSYTLTNATLADNGAKFRCRVASEFGTTFSNEATLTVTAPPSITTQPSNQTVLQGQSATFQVAATGGPTPSYQWQRNNFDIPGANSPTFTLTNLVLGDNGSRFRCVVSNTFGTVTSNEATLTVNAPASITMQPSNFTNMEGEPATFSVAATGNPTPGFQWQKNGENISGANSATLNIPATVFSDNGATFRCVVSNTFGSVTSNEVTLTVNARASITTQPSNQSVTEGQPATFTVVGRGTATLAYQWQRNGVPISGANSPTYNLPTTVLSDNGATFRCVVSNSFGVVISNEATLTVTGKVPILLAEANSDLVIALDSVSMMSGPFPLDTFFNFSPDKRTRLTLFANDTDLQPGENVSAITARAEDSLQVTHAVTVEFAGKLPGFDFTQLVIRLPDGLPSNSDVLLSITLHGQTSNKVRVRIQ
jgi:glucose/arabinose dehydrogenase